MSTGLKITGVILLVAAALCLEARSRRFESYYPDQLI